MQLTPGTSFLLLHRDPGSSSRSVCVIESRNAAVKNWQAQTRISPIFCVKHSVASSPSRFNFAGKHSVIFIGPVHPELVESHCEKGLKLWLSLGLFNVIISAPQSADVDSFLNWAKKEKLPYEVWTVVDARIKKINQSANVSSASDWRRTLGKLSEASVAPELTEAIAEYCPLMASTMSRGEFLPNQPFSGIQTINDFVCAELMKFGPQTGIELRYQALGQLLTINAGISRFASQTHAGTSPIFETECHFWSHSLLGIGTATLGLWKLRAFLQKTLGEQRLPQRFSALRSIKTAVPNLSTEAWPEQDILASITLPADDVTDPIIPLLSYFSARDGYRSTETTLSAPLASVSSCNSLRWSLLTVTHEISHVVIRAVLSELYPDLDDTVKIESCLDLLNARAAASSLFHEIRRMLLFALLVMDAEEAERNVSDPVNVDAASLKDILERWRHEVDETMVHVFDFLYFYGLDVDRYVSGIWMSWGTIPNVSTRVRGYVVRTVCAVMAKHLRRGTKSPELARDEVIDVLKKLDATGHGGRYVKQALDYLDKEWDREIRDKVLARRLLIKIVKCFLFSETAATSVRSEPEISGGATEKEGYTLKVGTFELRTIRNPLRFLELYTGHAHSSASDSAWMFYILAFGIQ